MNTKTLKPTMFAGALAAALLAPSFAEANDPHLSVQVQLPMMQLLFGTPYYAPPPPEYVEQVYVPPPPPVYVEQVQYVPVYQPVYQPAPRWHRHDQDCGHHGRGHGHRKHRRW